MAVISELNPGDTLDEAEFKRITGGDKMTSRDLHQSVVRWKPSFTPTILCNDVPKCSGSSSILRRIYVLKYDAVFVNDPQLPHERKRNSRMTDVLNDKDVKEALLSWIVDGAYDYYHNGLNPPECVQLDIQEYRNSQDSMQDFFEQETFDSTDDHYTSFAEIYRRYIKFCKDNDYPSESSKKALGIRLKKQLGNGSCKTIKKFGVSYKIKLVDRSNSLL